MSHDRFKKRALKRQNGVCVLCFGPITIDECNIEHLIPRSRGGSEHSYNKAIAHPRCNLEKGNMTYEEWIAFKGSQLQLPYGQN